tara:strand:+ start:3435 stop:3926 length:492 start_codon:yes stop_codon:yes gene_type:complete
MSLSKKEAIEDLKHSRVSNQQSLVKAIINDSAFKQIKRYIPAGKTLIDTVSKQEMPSAIYTWLRHCRNFTEVTLSLVDPLEGVETKSTKVVDMNPNGNNTEWESRGKKWLAEKMATFITKDGVVAIQVKRDGVYTLTTKETIEQADDRWMPYLEFTPFKPSAY